MDENAKLQVLTKPQREFLLVRADSGSDTAAAQEVGCSLRTVRRWKTEKDFREAYDLVVVVANDTVIHEADSAPLPEIPAQVQELVRKHGPRLERVFKRLFVIAEEGSDKDALAAINIIGRWFGIEQSALKPNALLSVQQTILSWTSPVSQVLGGEIIDGTVASREEGQP